MIKSIKKWVLDFLAPNWDSPEPELKYNYDFKTGRIKLCMKSLRESKVVQEQMAACMEQSKEYCGVTHTSQRKNKSTDRSRRLMSAKRSRRECPTTMHGL